MGTMFFLGFLFGIITYFVIKSCIELYDSWKMSKSEKEVIDYVLIKINGGEELKIEREVFINELGGIEGVMEWSMFIENELYGYIELIGGIDYGHE